MRVTFRLPYEDPDTGLRDRVYEKEAELDEIPAVGGLCPSLEEIGFPSGRVVERVVPTDDGCLIWLAAASGFTGTSFSEQRRVDARLHRFGWTRVRHRG